MAGWRSGGAINSIARTGSVVGVEFSGAQLATRNEGYKWAYAKVHGSAFSIVKMLAKMQSLLYTICH